MKLPLYQVDAFADQAFEGNPAAVVPLEAWIDAGLMQAIAAENNLAETAFFVAEGEGFGLRWFTPEVEVPLCGHATLASAHVLFRHLGFKGAEIVFQTLSGPLRVSQGGDGLLEMDFPARRGVESAVPPALAEALGAQPRAIVEGMTLLAIFDDPAAIGAMTPDFAALARFCRPLDNIGVAVTARHQGPEAWDFVSRFFAPAKGIDEDPVTGGAHCALTPYWAERLGKTRLTGRQLSRRGGTVLCEDRGTRVGLKGRCADYLVGEITV
ncbi:MAG: PhzF family phenazine biosynthesis protein [Caulobacter sp.]|nr:PhzF family phenazine biosynthesis protein [Caulobacter sp.]